MTMGDWSCYTSKKYKWTQARAVSIFFYLFMIFFSAFWCG
jgi:hypothetical protein